MKHSQASSTCTGAELHLCLLGPHTCQRLQQPLAPSRRFLSPPTPHRTPQTSRDRHCLHECIKHECIVVDMRYNYEEEKNQQQGTKMLPTTNAITSARHPMSACSTQAQTQLFLPSPYARGLNSIYAFEPLTEWICACVCGRTSSPHARLWSSEPSYLRTCRWKCTKFYTYPMRRSRGNNHPAT